MNRLPNSANSVLRQSIPLFSSSWLALFFTLRHGLAERRVPEPTAPPASVPGAADD